MVRVVTHNSRCIGYIGHSNWNLSYWINFASQGRHINGHFIISTTRTPFSSSVHSNKVVAVSNLCNLWWSCSVLCNKYLVTTHKLVTHEWGFSPDICGSCSRVPCYYLFRQASVQKSESKVMNLMWWANLKHFGELASRWKDQSR